MKPDQILTTIVGLIFTVLLSVIAFFGSATYSQLQTVTSQMTGHLIVHGKTDGQFDDMKSSVANMAWNQYLLCKYAEETWSTHEKCKRQK